MKLELKHICLYVPHKIKVIDDVPKVMNAYCGHSRNWVGMEYVVKRQLKPLLLPTTSLREEIVHNGEKFTPLEFIERKFQVPTTKYKGWDVFIEFPGNSLRLFDYEIFRQFAEWHIDVFGLIPAGLAVDKREVNNG